MSARRPGDDLDPLDALEDAQDLEVVREALADPANRDRIPWENLKAELSL